MSHTPTPDENLKTWPERIYLQHGDEHADELPPFHECGSVRGDVTWCVDKINSNDVEYVRSDKADTLRRQRDMLLESLKDITRIAKAVSITTQLGRSQQERIHKAIQVIKDCESTAQSGT